MGKVQSTFVNVYPGAISRSVDDIVITIPNTSDAAMFLWWNSSPIAIAFAIIGLT